MCLHCVWNQDDLRKYRFQHLTNGQNAKLDWEDMGFWIISPVSVILGPIARSSGIERNQHFGRSTVCQALCQVLHTAQLFNLWNGPLWFLFRDLLAKLLWHFPEFPLLVSRLELAERELYERFRGVKQSHSQYALKVVVVRYREKWMRRWGMVCLCLHLPLPPESKFSSFFGLPALLTKSNLRFTMGLLATNSQSQ